MYAADWLSILMVEPLDLWDVVPGLCPDIEDQVTQFVIEGGLDVGELRLTGLATIEAATGRPWWVALRLVHLARHSWEVVGGNLSYRRVDASCTTLGAWLDAVLLIAVQNMEQDKITMFTSQLEAPPPEFAGDIPEPEMDRSSFFALGA